MYCIFRYLPYLFCYGRFSENSQSRARPVLISVDFLGTMVSSYKRKTQPINKEQLAKAIEAVHNGGSVFAASKEYGIAYETLRTNSKPSKNSKHGSMPTPSDCAGGRVRGRGGGRVRGRGGGRK